MTRRARSIELCDPHPSITPEAICILTDKVAYFHELASEIREWAQLRGLEGLHRATAVAEDLVMGAVREQIGRRRNFKLDRIVNEWMRERSRWGLLEEARPITDPKMTSTEET